MSTDNPEQEPANLQTQAQNQIIENRGWYIFQGIVAIAVGILAIAMPIATAIGFNFVIGTILVVGGIVQGILSFRTDSHWAMVVLGILAIIVGIMLLVRPFAGTLTLATLLSIFLAIHGICQISFAFELRPMKNWGWVLASGAIALLIAVMLFAGWPVATLVFLGTVIGFSFLIHGLSLLSLTVWAQNSVAGNNN